MFKTEAEAGLNGRALAYPRGKVIGGSSAINAMISMRGQAADYDHWRQLGLTGWGWDDVRPVLQAAGGSLPRRHRAPRRRRRLAHRGAAAVVGDPRRRRRTPRARWASESSPTSTPATTKASATSTSTRSAAGAGRRRAAFSNPRCDRPNLKLLINVLADRLIIEGGRATGIRFLLDNEPFEARAKGEVILAAGSIGSTQILHRSGIGPHEWLSSRSASTSSSTARASAATCRTTCSSARSSRCHGVRTLNETYHNLFRRGLMGLDYLFRRRGPLTMAPSQLGIFTRSDPMQERANIQFHIQPLSLDKFGDPLHRFPAITASRLQPAPDLARHDQAAQRRASPTRRSSRRTIWRRRRTNRSPPTPSASRAS